MTDSLNRTILIVDDEKLLREAIAYEFNKRGFRALTAGSGNEAYGIIEREKIDVVLTDVRMPDGDGIGLLSRIKKLDAAMPVVVFITAFTDITIEDAYNMGACAIICKPFDRKELQSTVARAIRVASGAWDDFQATEDINSAGTGVDLLLDDLESSINGRVIGIGRGGMFVTSDRPLPEIQSRIRFRLRFNHKPPDEFNGTGVVRWSRSAPPPLPSSCGIEFIALDRKTAEAVQALTGHSKTAAFIPKA
ncbi:MAG: hypothetical protein A2583_11395 [Bdellovibrionales bacterium RIFOXYD1_FULL_53_11]|nr:MAG: hypothetical protein A2583_11395 [Bdellovibrionales bacterium RIFOXYD1_FULL_53_11]